MTSFYPLEYISVLRRRKIVFFSVFMSLFLISLIFAMNWSKYRAYATVEVARPEIALEALTTSGSPILSAEALADLKISRLKQTVFSTSSLAEIIAKLDLYPEARKETPIAYVAQNMRKKIHVSLVSTSLANAASAQKATALQLSAIAFVISFEYADPLQAQKTVNELVTRFLDQDLKDRRKTSFKTSEFLQAQIKTLESSLEEQEEKIAAFRAENGNIRPDALAFNQQASITTTSRLLAIESELISNLGLIGALRAQLVQTEPYALVLDQSGEVLTTPSIQLRVLKSQYASLRSKYGYKHPDVLKAARQIKALEKEIGPQSNVSRLKAKIADVETKIKTNKDAYGAQHPDVSSLKDQRGALVEQLKVAQISDVDASIQKDADNPAYLNIVAQLQTAELQQAALTEQRDEIKARQLKFQKAIAANPESEQKFAALTRDYDNMMMLYRELTAKKLSSDMNKTIEEGHSGHRLAVINPPELPRGTNPSKKVIVLAGFVFSLMAGIGSVLGLQILSGNVVGPKHLESIIGVPPLVTVKHLYSLDDRIRCMGAVQKAVTIAPIALVVLLILFAIIV